MDRGMDLFHRCTVPYTVGRSGDALLGVVSSYCGLSFFDNSDDLRWGNNLGRDGEMLKVACHKK